MINVYDIVDSELSSANERENKKHSKRQPGIFYASEAMQCPRKIYISVMHPNMRKEKMPLGLFYMGKSAEEAIIKCVRSSPGICVQEQIGIKHTISPKVTIHGYADFGLLDDNGNYKEFHEIKSVGFLSYIEKEESAKVHHRAQLQCYLQNKKCNNGSIIYVERSDICKIKQFPDTLDYGLWKDIVNTFTEISDYMEDEKMPPPIPIADWECKYCEFANDCKEERKWLTKRNK